MWSLTNNAEAVLEEVYKPLPKGYRIATEDRNSIDKEGGRAATYGEMLYTSFASILEKAALSEDDVFLDMGSGIGKLVLQAVLQTPVKKAIGIEASMDRHFTALEAKANLLKKLSKEEQAMFDQKARFQCADFLGCDISEVSFIFLCATCFNNALMNQIANHIIEAPRVRLVVSLARFTISEEFETAFELVETTTYPTSWSEGSKVFYYRRR